jgi:hypothetical protein
VHARRARHGFSVHPKMGMKSKYHLQSRLHARVHLDGRINGRERDRGAESDRAMKGVDGESIEADHSGSESAPSRSRSAWAKARPASSRRPSVRKPLMSPVRYTRASSGSSVPAGGRLSRLRKSLCARALHYVRRLGPAQHTSTAEFTAQMSAVNEHPQTRDLRKMCVHGI